MGVENIMGAVKRFLERIAHELGTEDITDPEVIATAERIWKELEEKDADKE